MENDYIKREDLIRFNEQTLKHIDDGTAYHALDAWIDNAPAADAIEVVRCKDCRYSYEEPYSMGIAHRVCAYGACVDCEVEDYFYCAYGARMDESEGDNG